MIKTLFFTAFTFACTILSAQTIAGVNYTDYGCSDFAGASSFYANKEAYAFCLDCNDTYFLTGKWVKQDKEVQLKGSKEWTIKNGKAIVQSSNRVISYPLSHFKNEEYINGCTGISFFDGNDVLDINHLLRNNLEGNYAFTKDRLVTHSDIANLSKQELRLMRNEIYARYGLIFNSTDLKNHFNNLDGYQERLNDVTAFLSPIELKNIDFIKKYE